jgi:hypothetical protein
LGFDADRLTLGEYMERWLEGPLKRSVATNTYEDYAYRATEVRNPGARRYKAQCFTCKLGGLKARLEGFEPPTQGLACRLLQQRPLQQRLAPRSYYLIKRRVNRNFHGQRTLDPT